MSKSKNRWSAVDLPYILNVAHARHAVVTPDPLLDRERALAHDRSDEIRALAIGERFWVTDKMMKVALDAARDIPEIAPTEMPTPWGCIAVEDYLPEITNRFDFDALEQAMSDYRRGLGLAPDQGLKPVPGSGTARPRLVTWAKVPRGTRHVPVLYPWLGDEQHVLEIAAWQHVPSEPYKFQIVSQLAVCPNEVVRFEEMQDLVGGEDIGILAWLMACWSLMMTPTVASRRTIDVKTGGAPRMQAPRDQLVTTIDLRPMRVVEVEREPGEGGRVYTHQWMVRGHWRNQAVGANREGRRLTWVPSYIKGPAGAPLLETEKVFVWRR